MTVETGSGQLRWRPSPLMRALASCAAAALAVAVVLGRADLIVFSAPLLGVLAADAWRRPSGHVEVVGEPSLVRCFEKEPATVSVAVRGETEGTSLRIHAVAAEGLDADVGEVESGPGAASAAIRYSARRWGRYEPSVEVETTSRAGLALGRVSLPAALVCVYPLAPPRRTPLPEVALPDRIGTHRTHRRGQGSEFADVRPWQPGDPLRVVNWPVTARRGRLHVTDRLADRAADVVVVIDTSMQAPGPASESIDRAARGAAQVARSAVRAGDRAGVVLLGHRTRWLGAESGRRQFYRILDAVLDVGAVAASGTLAPRAALPPGAVVVAFSTLLDTSFALALIDLARRGHPVLAVDVLDVPPFAEPLEPIPAQLWRLERRAMYGDLATVGVPVVSWAPDLTLDEVLRVELGHLGGHRMLRPRSRSW